MAAACAAREGLRQASSSRKKQAIALSDSAAKRIRQLLDLRNKDYLRVGVKVRGCNGYSYTMNYADQAERHDELVEDKGVKVLIDPRALMKIIGTKMDFIEDRLKSEFVFLNPNATGTCGCGESFTAKEK
ncbi:hypothetical protein SELMODRAFT_228144 [Selaginella moellendorffii]|uniref:Core domain-containing protein n=2 Tax=Selaginella moellendorffii TaxID=88036 RepID=D8RNR4_SELML|nr:iron-sulfur assembly protein IscA-like 3, mitochondrial isoform X2 [Selaginella moellendorffii]XP_024517657.1 iron-sulfur assembly protein IscA-like 3, mitochondrial isoform X2 [Selaginella moellendorffii]XP_024533560.1 iron-sulfur assembly protein IscA-like 3, mitochondrial isoform X2 [Selaginella moellendorffii]XP_024533562.1 iron-sulfur assembly protein IscA-like 3, mitochondrial isoform X2 [Selaginella moellendorffii]EFJ10896.1 hypothetical protein SELMODRAFT_159176 [Selaginella moellend|eukprot:XP_024517656.1 iron-sulfur assembly protein IscA-like 3, mitochondrial isoform X2 [Selaginella moellendorffii]